MRSAHWTRRLVHSLFNTNDCLIGSPTAWQRTGRRRPQGPKDFSMPKEMTKEDMATVKAEIVQAALNALEAGPCPEP